MTCAMAPKAALAFSALALLALPLAAARPAQADTPYGPSKQERDVYDYGINGGSKSGGSILDATNPIELMNRIRRSTALDDSTPPGDAVDQALKALELQTAPAAPGSSLVKAP